LLALVGNFAANFVEDLAAAFPQTEIASTKFPTKFPTKERKGEQHAKPV